MKILFVCRGNAFRSIIAEAYLKSLNIPGVTVFSNGTVARQYKDENKVNFPKTLAILKKHGLDKFAKDYYAEQLTQANIDKSNLIIFLNERAYQEATDFKLPKHIKIWDVTDIGEPGRIANNDSERDAFSQDVYVEIVEKIDELIKTISSST